MKNPKSWVYTCIYICTCVSFQYLFVYPWPMRYG